MQSSLVITKEDLFDNEYFLQTELSIFYYFPSIKFN